MTSNVVRLLRQSLEQHAGVLFRRSAEAEVIEGENAIAVGIPDVLEEAGLGEVPIRGGRVRERAVDQEERAIRRSGLGGLERAGRQRFFCDLYPPFLEPSLLPEASFKSLHQLGQHQAHASFGGNLDDLDHDSLDCLTDHAPRGVPLHGDLEAYLRRPAHPAALGLHRPVKCQRAGWMPNSKNGSLAGLQVVAEIKSVGTCFPATRLESRLQNDFLGDARFGGEELRR